MKSVRVLVADDSALARSLIIDMLSGDEAIDVAGEAADGKEALEMAVTLRPDIITMDVNMPVMNGIEAIMRIMSVQPTPILVLTSNADADTAYEAISNGALEVVQKPEAADADAMALIKKVKLLSQVKVISHIRGRRRAEATAPPLPADALPAAARESVIAVAASTGGPKALSVMLSAFPPDFPVPVVIAQHIDDDFLAGMASWLNGCSGVPVKVCAAGERITAGTAYLSPSKTHTRVDAAGRIELIQRRPGDIYFPSCDLLLASAARHYGENSIGVILTGIGDDGVAGMKEIKASGGFTIAQDEATSAVFGMPGNAVESGCVDRVVPVSGIFGEIMKRLNARRS